MDYIYHHIFSSNLGEPMAAPRGRYKCEAERHVGNLWLRHSMRWRRFAIAASAGASFTPYGTSVSWAVSGRYGNGGWQAEAGAAQSMRLPTFTDLYYTSEAQVNNPNLKPERAVTYHIGGGYAIEKWHASVQFFYRDGRNVIDWVWRDELTIGDRTLYDKWHSEQESHLGTFGIEASGGYRSDGGVVRRATVSYGYLTTSRLSDVRTSSILDYMRHKLSFAAEIRFLRRFSLAVTGTLFDRYGFYNRYLRDADGKLLTDDKGRMQTEEVDFSPYFLLDGHLRWEKGIVALHVDLANITDTDYCDFGGLRRPNFWITGGITLTIR